MRLLAAAALAMLLLVTPASLLAQEATTEVEAPAPPPASPDFYPARFLGQGDAYNCADFVSQADAQAVLRADPSDPNQLDTDRPRPDGIACESIRAPFDRMPVPR